jgi:outer membrane protein assembly factor BamB
LYKQMTKCLVLLMLMGLLQSTTQAQTAKAHKPDANTMVLLNFDSAENGVVKDSSGNGNDAVFEAAPRDPKWHAKGRFGGCMAFDGKNIDENGDGKGDADTLRLHKGGAPDPSGSGFTVELWARHANLKGQQYYITRTSVKPGRYTFGTKGNGVYIAFLLGDVGWVRAHAPNTLKEGMWHHIAFTYDNAFLRIYVDGVEKAKTASKGKLLAGVQQSVIGRDTSTQPDQIRGFCGLMDELRISNVARTKFPKGPYETKDPLPSMFAAVKAQPSKTNVPSVASGISLKNVVLDRGGLAEKGQQIKVAGIVFLDVNGNGKKDAQDTPLKDVYVSNGEDILKTDENGKYSFAFAINDPRFIFVTVPTGHTASKTFYRRIALSKELAYQYDFGLTVNAASNKSDFSFVTGSDIQYPASFTRIYNQLTSDFSEIAMLGKNSAFATFAGDLTNLGELNDLMILKKVTQEVWQKPFHVGFGAHDAINPTKMGNYMDVFGPYYYSWDYGNSHFIFLTSEDKYIRGEPVARQTRWLMKDVALQPKDKPIYVICHTPEHINAQLVQIAKTRNLKAIIRGHWHINNIYEGPGGVPVICTAPYRPYDWGVFTRKCRVVMSNGETISSKMRVLGQVKRLIITAPIPGGTITPGKSLVQANAYDTANEIAKATYEITAPDGSKKTGTLQQKSDFTFSSSWDASNAQPGSYKIKVAVKTATGIAWEKTESFKCAKAPQSRPNPTTNWPSIFGVDHQVRIANQNVKPPLRLAWIGHTGGLIYYFSSPVVVDGKVLIGVTDGEIKSPRAGVACFDGRTGQRLWKTKTDADIHSSIAALGNNVYALDTEGRVNCIDIKSGRILWTKETHKPRFGWTMAMGPVSVNADRVYVKPDYAGIYSLNAKTGDVVWRLSEKHNYYSTSNMSVFNNTGYTSQQAYYAAVDLQSGKFLWNKKIKSCRGMSAPTRYGDRLYIPHRAILRAVNPDTGDEIWQTKLSPIMTQSPGMAVEKDGRVFATCGDGIYGLDAQTGKQIWKVTTNESKLFIGNKFQSIANSSSPAVSGDYVYVGSDNGTFYCIEAATGKVAWRYYIGVPIKSSPAISGNMVVVSAFDGNVYAFVDGTK